MEIVQAPLTQQPPASEPQSAALQLRPGQVIQGEITVNDEGQPGLVFKGKFLQANIVGEFPLDKTASFRVTQLGPPPVLELLQNVVQSPSELLSTKTLISLFEQILQRSTPQLQLKDLFSKEFLQLAKNAPLTPQTANKNSVQAAPQPLQQALESFIQSNLTLSENALHSPATTLQTLERLVSTSSLQTQRENLETLREISSQDHVEVTVSKVIQETHTLLQQFEKILNAEQPSQPTAPLREVGETLLPEARRVLLQLAKGAQQLEQRSLVQEALQVITEFDQASAPKAVVAAVLTLAEKFLSFSKTPAQSELEPLITRLLQSLPQTAPERNEENSPILQTVELKSLVKSVLNKLEHLISQPTPTKGQESIPRLIQQADILLKAHETANRLNTVAQNLGEPIFAIVPALISGFLSHWEMQIIPPKVGDESGRKQKPNDDYVRIQSSLVLPNLGEIQIDLAHNRNEILLSLSLQDDSKVDHIEQHLGKLEHALRDLGYNNQLLVTRTAPTRSNRPEWLVELRKKSVRA
ncbi:MAG: hypothetical protein KDD64_12455 [Bdellovibrionales bacterium]|nr:hypothetical protein [Bdellovibrionales bacterium]